MFQLVRRLTRQMLVVLQRVDQQPQYYEEFAKCLDATILKSTATMGCFMHFTELFMEEVSKVYLVT